MFIYSQCNNRNLPFYICLRNLSYEFNVRRKNVLRQTLMQGTLFANVSNTKNNVKVVRVTNSKLTKT